MIAGAYDWTDDMLKIKSMQKKFRDSFNGTEINPARWEIAATGGGITHTVADGAVTISTGTTLDDELTLTSRTTFTIPLRVMVAVNMSQRIVGQSVWLELVSIDPTTAQPDGRSAAAWRLDGASPTLANYEVGSEGAPRLGSASGSASVARACSTPWNMKKASPTRICATSTTHQAQASAITSPASPALPDIAAPALKAPQYLFACSGLPLRRLPEQGQPCWTGPHAAIRAGGGSPVGRSSRDGS
jgi:hypothetical protein